MSPKQSSCVVTASIDFVISAPDVIHLVRPITSIAGIVAVIQVAVRVDGRRWRIVSVRIIRSVLKSSPSSPVLPVTMGQSTPKLALSSSSKSIVKPRYRLVTNVRSHKYPFGYVMALLLIRNTWSSQSQRQKRIWYLSSTQLGPRLLWRLAGHRQPNKRPWQLTVHES